MLLLLSLACSPPGDGKRPSGDDTADTSDAPDPADGLDDARAALRGAIEAALPETLASGAQAAVWLDGEIVYSEGFGVRDPQADEPVLTTTLFEVGSDAKKLTAIALLQQVEAGRLALDTPVSEALTGFTLTASPEWAAETTLHELLSHQGGLVDYTPWDDAPEDAELARRAYERLAADGWAMLPSGVAFNYANPNFALAGLALERADGRFYADILAQDVFAPLGLARTFARESEVQADGDYAIGTGYYLSEPADTFYVLSEALSWEFGRVDLEHHPDNGFTRPAGMVWSTAEDMARLIAFLIDGDERVLSDALRESVAVSHVTTYPGAALQGYGYGLFVQPEGFTGAGGWYATPLWFHGGNTLSYTSTWCAAPEARVVVTIQSNGYGDAALFEACRAGLEAFAELPEPTEAPAFLSEVGDREPYAGTWYDPHQVGTIEITTDGAALYVEMPDLEAMGYTVRPTLNEYGADVFTVVIDGYEYELLYYDGEDGTEKKYLVDRIFTASKVDPEQARPLPPGGRLAGLAPTPLAGPGRGLALPTGARPGETPPPRPGPAPRNAAAAPSSSGARAGRPGRGSPRCSAASARRSSADPPPRAASAARPPAGRGRRGSYRR